MTNANVRPAQPSDGLSLPASGRAWVMVKDDQLLGYGGVLYGDFPQAFMNLTPEALEWPVLLAKSARAFRRVLDQHETVFAIADHNYPTAPRFLEWIGFEPAGYFEGRRLYRWHSTLQ